MRIHESAFWFCALFLIGVFLMSILDNFLIIMLSTLLFSLYLIIFKKYYYSVLILFIIVGAFYFQAFDYFYEVKTNIIFNEKITFNGLVTNIREKEKSQDLTIELKDSYKGKIKIIVQKYPSYSYGDLIKITGIVKEPLPDSKNYFAKEGLLGISIFSNVELLDRGQGNFLKSNLLNLKNSIVNSFKRILPPQKAAFLSGITLGEREQFSDEFNEKMSLSGTTHLVALSGYNIAIIAWAVALMLGSYFSRTTSFYLSVGIIVLFVLMTGGEASIIRAAIMGIIALLAAQTERMFSMKNAMVISAFLMILFNPRLLVFDLGFQLSFAALLGLVYILPVLKNVFNFETGGFLSWKENAITTLSAQLAVMPLLLVNFGTFSLSSLFANILILEVVPLTMGLGFIMGVVSFVSDFLASMIGRVINLLLSYELWIIDIFSKITIPIKIENFSIFMTVIYYLVLVSVLFLIKKRSLKESS